MPRFKRLSLSIAGTASVALASLPLAIGPASAARVPVGTTPSIGVMEASSNASQFNLGSHRAQGASSDLVGQNQPKAIPFPKPTTTTTGEGPGGRTAKPTDLRPTPCRPNGPTPCTTVGGDGPPPAVVKRTSPRKTEYPLKTEASDAPCAPCTDPDEATPQRLPCRPNGPAPCTTKPPRGLGAGGRALGGDGEGLRTSGAGLQGPGGLGVGDGRLSGGAGDDRF